MGKFGRFILATLMSPFAVVPAVFLSVLGLNLVDLLQVNFVTIDWADRVVDYFDDAAGLSFLGVMFGWVYLIMFGLPAYAVLALCGLSSPIPCTLVGTALGLLLGTSFGHGVDTEMIVIMTPCGAAVAYTFSRIVGGGQSRPKEPLYPDESVS